MKQQVEKICAKSVISQTKTSQQRQEAGDRPPLPPHLPFPLQSNHVTLHLLRPSFRDSPHHHQERKGGRTSPKRSAASRERERPAKRESDWEETKASPCKGQLGAVSREERPIHRLVDSISISLPGPRDGILMLDSSGFRYCLGISPIWFLLYPT